MQLARVVRHLSSRSPSKLLLLCRNTERKRSVAVDASARAGRAWRRRLPKRPSLGLVGPAVWAKALPSTLAVLRCTLTRPYDRRPLHLTPLGPAFTWSSLHRPRCIRPDWHPCGSHRTAQSARASPRALCLRLLAGSRALDCAGNATKTANRNPTRCVFALGACETPRQHGSG